MRTLFFFAACTAVENILVNRSCQCRDIFLCPHEGDSGYSVLISDFDSALQVDRGREKLEKSNLYGRPIKYSVHGTPGYRPPEVGERRDSNPIQSSVLYECNVLCSVCYAAMALALQLTCTYTAPLLLERNAAWKASGDSRTIWKSVT